MLNKLRDEIHENAKKKGFYDDEKYIHVLPNDLISQKSVQNAFFAQKIALIHSELSEALEADRKDKYCNYHEQLPQFKPCMQVCNEHFISTFNITVKDTVEDELSDVIIRVLDLCGHLGIDIEKHIELKMKYNSQREYLHGKKY